MQTVTTSYNKNKSNKNMNTFQVPQLTLSTNQLRQLYTPFGKELIQWMKNEMNVDGENVTFNCDADTILNRFIDHICNSTNKVAKKPTGKKGKTANKVTRIDESEHEDRTLSNCARTFIAMVGVSLPFVTISSRESVKVIPSVDRL